MSDDMDLADLERVYILADGKYELRRWKNGKITAKRYGDCWTAKTEDLVGDNLTRALIEHIDDLTEVLDDKRRLTRDLDVALNGQLGAAKQASLCDLVSQATSHAEKHGPALAPRARGCDTVIVKSNRPLGHGVTMKEIEDNIDEMNEWMEKRGSDVRFMYIGEAFDIYIAEDRKS